MDSIEEHEIGLAKCEDFDELKSLFDQAVRPDYIALQPEFFKWQYIDCPGSKWIPDGKLPCVISRIGGVIVNALLFTPSIFITGQKEVNGMVLSDWYSLPDRKDSSGLQVMLWAKKNADIVIAPGMNNFVTPIYRRMRFNLTLWERCLCVLDVPALEKMIDVSFSMDQKQMIAYQNINNKYEYELSESIPEVFLNEIQNVEPYNHAVKRDLNFLDWRYRKHPLRKYHLFSVQVKNACIGVISFFLETVQDREEKVLRICEWICKKEYDSILCNAAYKFAIDHNAILMDFFTPSKIMSERLMKVGFKGLEDIKGIQIPRLFQPLEMRQRPSINSGIYIQLEEEYGPNDLLGWYFTKGDGNQDRPNDLGYQILKKE